MVLAAVAISKSNDTPNINVNGNPSGSGAPSSGAAATPIVITTNGAAGAGAPSGAGGKRIYTIAYGHDWGAHNYLDKEGYIVGFSKELIEAVCEAAGVDCRTVWDKWTNCWDSTAGEHSLGGQGLLDGWYDACMGWTKTVSRIQTFAFGTGYRKAETGSFYIKKGTAFNPKDITGKKIGFMDGWMNDEKCLARQKDITGNELPVDKIVHFLQVKDAVDSLLNGTVDALTGDDTTFGEWVNKNQLESSGEFACYLSGNSVMTRKDNDFITYWNDGFAKIQSSGKFSKLCADAEENHGPVNCI